MNRVLESRNVSPQTIANLGIAVHKHGLHIGVLYRVNQFESVRILHLGHHDGLASDTPTSAYVCWVRPTLEVDRARAVAALCRRIWKQNRSGRVPYGFSSPNDFFDMSGRVLKGRAKVGLTCASFVLAVFAAANLPLVKIETWPAAGRKDMLRQKKLLGAQLALMSAEHAGRVSAEIGNFRYHPLEVAGAATAESLPTDHQYAVRMAKKINTLLTRILSEHVKK